MLLEKKAQEMEEIVELENVNGNMFIMIYGERRVSVLTCCQSCSCTAFELTGKHCWHLFFCQPYHDSSLICACDPPLETLPDVIDELDTSEDSEELEELRFTDDFPVVSLSTNCPNPARYRKSERKRKPPNHLKSYVMY